MTERRFSYDEPIMVSIRCITYNHAPYIRQCLEGFVMQKTNFRFQAVVHDDASTDGTTEIVKEYAEKYPDIIVPMYEEENRWSKHDGTLLTVMLPYMYCAKYWAECEGDDYWTDPLKLQKQVDILESNRDIKLVYTAFKCVGTKGENIIRSAYNANMRMSTSGDVLDKLFQRNFIQTCSICMRMELIKSSILQNCPSKFDYAYFLTSACAGDVAYIPQITCAYRKSDNGVTIAFNKEVNNGLWNVYRYFVSIYYSGKTKRIRPLKRQFIRCNILYNYLKHENYLKELIEYDSWIFLYFPFAYFLLVLNKIKNYYYYYIDQKK